MTKHKDLTTGPIRGHILRMTPPMILGMFSMMAFNLTDTFFISKLGTIPLAAMGFTFPLVMLLHSMAFGMGMGISAVVSRAIGKGDTDRVQILTTYALVLTFLVILAVSVTGQFLLDPLLKILGAGKETLPLTRQYLRIWLVFSPLGVLPMAGNNAIRATGDTVNPMIIMTTASLLNVALDPLLIFGLGPVPALGITGAALATAGTRLLTFVWSVLILRYRKHMITRRWPGLHTVLGAWKEIVHIAAPAAATNLLIPLTMGVITRMVAGFGEAAVAAGAAGQRIEQFAFMIPMAMGSVLMPIIGQNWGADQHRRAVRAWATCIRYAALYTAVCLLIFLPTARLIAGFFSKDPEVARLITYYIWISTAGGILVHAIAYTGFAFNAIGKPLNASAIMVIRLVVLVVPLAWAGSRLFGILGLFGGMAVAYTAGGVVAIFWFLYHTRHSTDKEREPAASVAG